MKREATVVEKDGRLMAEVVRSEACQQCRACQFGQTESVLVELPEGDFHPGDSVELTLEEGRFAQATLLAYALPVVFLFAGLLIAAFCAASEVWQAVCALAGLGVGLIVIKILEPRLRSMQPEARPCEKKEE